MKNVIWMLILLSMLGGACTPVESEESIRIDSLRHELLLERDLRFQIQDYANDLYFQLTSSGRQPVSISVQPSPKLPTRPVTAPKTANTPAKTPENSTEISAPDAVPDLGDLSNYPNLRIRNAGTSKILTFPNEMFFEIGKRKLTAEGQEDIRKIAEALKDREDYLITVEGHTDNLENSLEAGIANRWELSLMRASEVAISLIAQGVSPHRVVVSGRGQFKPRVPNETASARNRNRRIEIILTPIRSRR